MATFSFGGYTGEDDIKKIKSYLFMLNEQLRYMFANMDPEDNFSEESLRKYLQNGEDIAYLELTADQLLVHMEDAENNIAQLVVRADSITAQVENNKGDISTLQQTATSLTSQIQNAQGDISTLQQTATSLTSQIKDAQGNISTLQQTATSLTSQINDAKGNISTLQQTATSLSSEITNAKGDISTLKQTATSLTSKIENAEGNISKVKQTADKIEWIVKSGTSASSFTLTDRMASLVSKQIDLTGYVTISDLKGSGKTTINGDNITTGSLDASLLKIGGTTVFETVSGSVVMRQRFWPSRSSILSSVDEIGFVGSSKIRASSGKLYIDGQYGVSLCTEFSGSSLSSSATLSNVISSLNSVISWIKSVD